jgi:hypothetical protein
MIGEKRKCKAGYAKSLPLNAITASLPIDPTLDYQTKLGATGLDEAMKAAVLSGAMSDQPLNTSIIQSCPTGNCTWLPYKSLAVCRACQSPQRYSPGQLKHYNATAEWREPLDVFWL